MSITDFPFWEMCLESLSNQCDELYLRFDSNVGDPKILDRLKNPSFCDGKIKAILESTTPWNKWHWREEMLRMLDDVKPDVILVPDQDEAFEDTIKEEIKEFWDSDRFSMMVPYKSPMPTIDGFVIGKQVTYPPRAHMKIYKWGEKLTYRRYKGFAKVSNYARSKKWAATSKINHYCFYTEELRDLKRKSIQERIGAGMYKFPPVYFKKLGLME